MEIKIVNQDTGKEETRDFERATMAFWSKFKDKEISVSTDGEKPILISSAGELKDYVAEQNKNNAKAVTIEHRTKKQELDWNNFSKPETVSVAVYSPDPPVKKENVKDILSDLSSKIETAASKNAGFFVAPEYTFTKHKDGVQTPISKEEHAYLAAELGKISDKYPDMLIVAGTSLWVNKDNKLQNTAFVLNQGTLTEYHKATIPHGDAIFRDALQHHLNNKDPAGSEKKKDITYEEIKNNVSLGGQPSFDIITKDAKCRVAICSDLSSPINTNKNFDIELVTSSALGEFTDKKHHVHQGGHVFVADREDGPAHFAGSEKQQSKLPRGENGLTIHTCEIRKQLTRGESVVAPLQGTLPQPQRRENSPSRADGSVSHAAVPTRRPGSPPRLPTPSAGPSNEKSIKR